MMQRLTKIYKSFRNQKGSALLLILLLMVILSVLASSVLLTTMNNFYVSQRMSEYEDEYYISEASVQHALEFIKQKAIVYYNNYYQNAYQDDNFLIDLTRDITTVNQDGSDNQYSLYIPMDFSEEDVTVDTTIEKSTKEVSINGEMDASLVYTYIVTCNAQSLENGTERTVIGEISISNPKINSSATTTPPVVEQRILVGNEIVSSNGNSWRTNSILCYSDVKVGNAFSSTFESDHNTAGFDSYDYEVSNGTNDLLEWDLQYSKFPTHVAFTNYEALYEKSRGQDSDIYSGDSTFSDKYNIERCEPGYTISEFTKEDAEQAKEGATYYGNGQSLIMENITGLGSEYTIQKMYIDGEVIIKGTGNLTNLYYYSDGPVTIDITGTIDNCIFISNSDITITCSNIENDENNHKIIKANGSVKININDVYSYFYRNYNYNLKNVIVYSENGDIVVDDKATNGFNAFTKYNEKCLHWYTNNNSSYSSFVNETVVYANKIGVNNCYFYTNKNISNASQGFTNVYFHNSFINAGKDLILNDCSGDNSCFYAHGSDFDDKVRNQDWNSFENDVDNLLFNSYNHGGSDYSFEVSHGGYHYVKTYTGITILSNIKNSSNDYSSYYTETVFNNCDFTSGENINFGIPNNYENANYDENIKASKCRFMANNEVFIESVQADTCYIFAGIDGYDSSADSTTIYNNIAHGITIKSMDPDELHSRVYLKDTVMYSRGKILYYNNANSTLSSSTDVTDEKQFYNCLLYCLDSFEYNGTVLNDNTLQNLNYTTLKSSYSNYLNDVIIMTKNNLKPHSGYGEPSYFNILKSLSDFMIIGGSDTSDDSNTEGVKPQIINLVGEEATNKGKNNNINVESEILYNNYFEQMADDVNVELPSFDLVFLYEDIYEKEKADSPYD